MAIEKVLVVDDEQMICDFLKETLQRKNVEVTVALNGKSAIAALKKEPFDLIFTDMKMPGISGLDIIKQAKELNPSAIVIVITGFATVENAVEAMRFGAFNYLIKPFTKDIIDAVFERAKEQLALVSENQYLRTESSGGSKQSKKVIASSPALKKILSECDKVAKSNAAVFITGESGTGKEVIASYIHNQSERANKPYIKVNCAAMPETLVESEFFGYEKGAFTGASARKEGRFELADKGTLLLDEVTEIPLALQAKLLRVTQEQEFERVGGTKSIKVDVRLISTSNRSMKEAINNKIFREDLFYRLNVVPIHLPPLRDRKEEILPLAEAFLEKQCHENHKATKTLSKSAKKKLIDYNWPGNIRELANIIERAVVLDRSNVIEAEDLILDDISNKEILTLQELEKRHIIEVLHKENEDTRKAAKALGITETSLTSKLSEYS